MIRKSAKTRIYDAVHHGWVYACWATTGLASVFLGYQAYIYVTQVRPLREEMAAKIKEELLNEGRNFKTNPKELSS